jgi:hypothetical protein
VVEGAPAVVDAGVEVVVAADGEAGEGDVGGGDAELLFMLVYRLIRRSIGECTSLLPRPKPLMTGPRSFSGKGACGVSGPAMGSRAPLGRTIVVVWGV